MFVYLPGSSASDLRQIISNLKDCGAEVSQFFHKKISYLITSNNCIEMEKRKKVISRKLLTDPSSRGAMFLGKATKEQSNDGIFEKAKRFGISIVSFDEISVFLSKSKDMSYSSPVKNISGGPVQTEIRKLRSPFIKVVDRTECFRPLVLEMKEWPDAFTMFSKGPNVVHEKMGRKREATFCELCNVRFDDLQKHLSSSKHTKNATDSKIWERVDALRKKLPTVEQLIESKIKQQK